MCYDSEDRDVDIFNDISFSIQKIFDKFQLKDLINYLSEYTRFYHFIKSKRHYSLSKLNYLVWKCCRTLIDNLSFFCKWIVLLFLKCLCLLNRAVRGVIECILSDIGYKYGVNCSRSDQQNALSFYGPTLQSSLPLKFSPTNCECF